MLFASNTSFVFSIPSISDILVFLYHQNCTCRLSGASLVVPFVNYLWACVPANLSREGFRTLLLTDQWAFRVAHYTPCLFYWWITQKWFPTLSFMTRNTTIFCQEDLDMFKFLETPISDQVVIQPLHN